MPGVAATILVAIPAIVFGGWAAHPAFWYSEEDGRAVGMDGGVLVDPSEVGWVVTHIATGRALPLDLVDRLTRSEAIAIASALDGGGTAVSDFDENSFHLVEHMIESIIAKVIGESP